MTTKDKIDLYKQFKAEYAAKKGKPSIVETTAAPYLIVDGTCAPGEAEFEDKVGGLYGMAYTMKLMSKANGQDYGVCKLEGLYGVNGQRADELLNIPKEEWNWRLMIRVPDFTRKEDLDAAREQLRSKGKEGDFDSVQLETIHEGKCVQVLHVGSYANEHESIAYEPTCSTCTHFPS